MSGQFTIVNKFNECFTNIGSELANQISKSGNKYLKDYLNSKHDSVFTFYEIRNMDIVKVIVFIQNVVVAMMIYLLTY